MLRFAAVSSLSLALFLTLTLVFLDLLLARYFVIAKDFIRLLFGSFLLTCGARLAVGSGAGSAVELIVFFGSFCSSHFCRPIWIRGRCDGDLDWLCGAVSSSFANLTWCVTTASLTSFCMTLSTSRSIFVVRSDSSDSVAFQGIEFPKVEPGPGLFLAQ